MLINEKEEKRNEPLLLPPLPLNKEKKAKYKPDSPRFDPLVYSIADPLNGIRSPGALSVSKKPTHCLTCCECNGAWQTESARNAHWPRSLPLVLEWVQLIG